MSFNSQKPCSIAVEIDQATETASYVVNRKAIPYADCLEANIPLLHCQQWAVVFIVPTVERRNQLCTTIWETGVPQGLFYFATTNDITDSRVLTKVWWTPRLTGNEEAARLVAENPFLCLVQRPGTRGIPGTG